MIRFFRDRWPEVLTVVGTVVLLGMAVSLLVALVFAFKNDVTVATWLMIWTGMYTAFTAFITLVLFIAAIAAGHQLRSMEKARQGQRDQLLEAKTARKAQVLTELSKRWDDPLISESRRRVSSFEGDPEGLSRRLQKLNDKNHREYYVLIRVANFFEDLAILVEEEALTPELVTKSLGDPIKYYWKLFRCYALAAQPELATFQHFAGLVEKLQLVEEKLRED